MLLPGITSCSHSKYELLRKVQLTNGSLEYLTLDHAFVRYTLLQNIEPFFHDEKMHLFIMKISTFVFCVLLLNQNTTYLLTQNHLGGSRHSLISKISPIDICFSLTRSSWAIAEKQTRKIAGTRSSKFVFYGFWLKSLELLHEWKLFGWQYRSHVI